MASGDIIKVIGSADSEIGKVTAFSHENADIEKYLHCDGSEVLRSTYTKLYAKVGDTFGAGDGSTTFNLPDFRGQFLRGLDGGAGVDPDGATRVLGSEQVDDFKSHDHSYSRFRISYDAGQAVVAQNNDGGYQGLSTGSRGGDETRPKNIAVKFYIRYEG